MDEPQEQNPPAHAGEEHLSQEQPPEEHQRDEGVPLEATGAEQDATELDDDDVMIAEAINDPVPTEDAAAGLKAVIEAAIYITDEPLTAQQMAVALDQPLDRIKEILAQLVQEYSTADRGLSIRELAGGFKMATKPEHHESIRKFVKKLQAPLKLSLAALETLAVVAYKQPITAPEIMDIRGVQGAGVLKTLLDRKLVAAAGRKEVIGKPILYKTTREFLIQFGLNSLAELPTLKEFEELGRFVLDESEEAASAPTVATAPTPAAHEEAEAETMDEKAEEADA